MKSLVKDLRDVFEENVGDPLVSWDVAAANYQDYTDEMIKQQSKSKKEKIQISSEMHRCSRLLLMKSHDPKNVAMSFVLWKNNAGRTW